MTELKPVAWAYTANNCAPIFRLYDHRWLMCPSPWIETPLYAHPPAPLPDDLEGLCERLEDVIPCLPSGSGGVVNEASAAIRALSAEKAAMRAYVDRVEANDRTKFEQLAAMKALIGEAENTIREAANQFRVYEHNHLSKKTQDGDEKAYRNKQWADRLFDLTAKLRSAQ